MYQLKIFEKELFMSTKEKVNIPSYCRDYLYNNGIKYSNGDMFSPNNIKRVLISPDGYYISLHTTQKPVFGLFDATYAGQCYYDEKYKPMMTALSSDLVCSNAE